MKKILLRSLGALVGLVLVLVLAGVVLFYWNTNPELDPVIQQLAALRKPGLDRVIVCIDGVSWSYIRRLQSQGRFHPFRPASKVIVTYPAMTNVALSDIWKTTLTPGYESLYFDRKANSMGGGHTTYVGPRKSEGRDYHAVLDYEEPRQYEFLVYVSPLRIIAADLRRSILRLAGSDRKELREYIKSSDGMIHIRGRDGADRFISHLDAFLSTLYEANGGHTEIIVFSDHGNEFLPHRRVPIDDVLRKSGFRVGPRLDGPRSVVIPAFGLVSFAALYAESGDYAKIAALVAKQPGVDFVMYRRGDTIQLQAEAGTARLDVRGTGEAFRYETNGADPLHLNPTLDVLKRAAKADPDGFIDGRDWFDATVESEYPDAPYRIWKGLTSQVDYPADLLVSFKAGYYYGSDTFDTFFSILATHGSLRTESSEAFLMSTHRDYPAALRGEDLIPYLGTAVALESYFFLHPRGRHQHTP